MNNIRYIEPDDTCPICKRSLDASEFSLLRDPGFPTRGRLMCMDCAYKDNRAIVTKTCGVCGEEKRLDYFDRKSEFYQATTVDTPLGPRNQLPHFDLTDPASVDKCISECKMCGQWKSRVRKSQGETTWTFVAAFIIVVFILIIK